jgi:hypothetical protein
VVGDAITRRDNRPPFGEVLADPGNERVGENSAAAIVPARVREEIDRFVGPNGLMERGAGLPAGGPPLVSFQR